MIKLGGLIDLLPEAESFTATNKDTGKTSVFKTKDARDAAVKAGTHEKRKGDKDGDDKKDTPKVNIFKKDKAAKGGDSSAGKSEPKSDSSEKAPRDDKNRIIVPKELELKGDIFNDDWYQQKFAWIKTKEEQDFVTDLIKKSSPQVVNKLSRDPEKLRAVIHKQIEKKKGEPKDEPKSDSPFGKLKPKNPNLVDRLKRAQEAAKQLERDREDGKIDNSTYKVQSAKVARLINALQGELEKKKEEPSTDSANSRPGNPQVNKAVRRKAESLGITPQKLGKEEYENRMSKAAVEALSDSNFHSEARKLIAVLEDKPEWANDPNQDPNKPDIFSPEYEEWEKTSVYSSELYGSSEGTDEIAHTAAQEAGWDGKDALDAIAFDLKMNGSKKLAAKLQGIIDDTNESSTKLRKLVPEQYQINEGTRSQVGIIDRSGKIASGYVHYDGYPSNMKKGLKKHMKNEKDVLTLIKKGGARGIYNDKDIEYYKMGKPTKGNLKDFDKYVDAADRNGMAEYVYLYNMKDKKWYFADVYGDKKLKKLF